MEKPLCEKEKDSYFRIIPSVLTIENTKGGDKVLLAGDNSVNKLAHKTSVPAVKSKGQTCLQKARRERGNIRPQDSSDKTRGKLYTSIPISYFNSSFSVKICRKDWCCESQFRQTSTL